MEWIETDVAVSVEDIGLEHLDKSTMKRKQKVGSDTIVRHIMIINVNRLQIERRADWERALKEGQETLQLVCPVELLLVEFLDDICI